MDNELDVINYSVLVYKVNHSVAFMFYFGGFVSFIVKIRRKNCVSLN